jgi:hypothetical protein
MGEVYYIFHPNLMRKLNSCKNEHIIPAQNNTLPVHFFILLLFVYGLFDSAIRSSDNTVPMIGLSVNNELDRMWEEVIMALFEVLPQNLCKS